MQLQLENIGKRYNNQWLFRHIDLTLNSGQSLSVTGKNGSGKSSLLQIVYGLVQSSEGRVLIDAKEEFESHSICALTSPYMELPLEFSLNEIHQLYISTFKTKMDIEAFLTYSEFSKAQSSRPVKLFSSGMLQRLKTALCLCSNAKILLLDEPLTNMDKNGEIWYKNCLYEIKNRIIIVAGNNPSEYEFANINIQLSV